MLTGELIVMTDGVLFKHTNGVIFRTMVYVNGFMKVIFRDMADSTNVSMCFACSNMLCKA